MSTLYDPLYAALVGGLIGAIGTWVAVVYQGRLNAKADQLAMNAHSHLRKYDRTDH